MKAIVQEEKAPAKMAEITPDPPAQIKTPQVPFSEPAKQMQRSESNTSVIGKGVKDKPEPQQQQPQKQDKPQITPAFNQGIRTPAPNDLKKPPPALSKPIEKPKEPIQTDVVIQSPMLRRNQQNQERVVPDKRVLISELRHHELKPGKAIVVAVSGNVSNNIFQVVNPESLSYIDDNVKEYLKTENTKSYKPMKNELVLAKFDGMYYRAQVEGLNDDGTFKIFFIDYGNRLSDLKEDELKPIGPKLQCETILNNITISNLSKESLGKIQELMANPEGFEIDVMGKEKDVYTVRICNV